MTAAVLTVRPSRPTLPASRRPVPILRSGEVAVPVALWDNPDGTDMAVTPADEALLVATTCVDRDVHSVLFTIG